MSGTCGAAPNLTTVPSSSGALRNEVAVEAQDRSDIGRVPEDGPGQDGWPDGVKVELERGDHAEVTAAASQRPEQIGVLVLGRPQQLAVRRHDVNREEVVDRQAVLAHQPADATAEGEPGNAGVAHYSAGG
jgi:hypothetical protein